MVELAISTIVDTDATVLKSDQIVQLIENIADHSIEAFVQCHKHLTLRLNHQNAQNSSELTTLATSQLKLCFHERDQHSHICVFKSLVSFFKTYKTLSQSSFSIDKNLFSKLIDFIPSFTCISQLPLLLNLFNVHALEHSELVSFAQHLIDQSYHIQAAIVISQLNLKQCFDSNHLLIQLFYEVSK